MKNSVKIYVISSINGVRKQDGYIGYLLEYHGKTLSEFVKMKSSTRNHAEIEAIADALLRLTKVVDLDIYTESTFVYSGITKWMHQWAENNWMNKKGEEISDRINWEIIYQCLSGCQYEIHLNDEYEYKIWLKSEVFQRSKNK